MRLVLLGIALFSVIDYFATARATAYGVAELNPIMDAIVHTPLFPLLKLVIIPGALLGIYVIRERWMHRMVLVAGMWILLCVYGALTAWHVWGQVRL